MYDFPQKGKPLYIISPHDIDPTQMIENITGKQKPSTFKNSEHFWWFGESNTMASVSRLQTYLPDIISPMDRYNFPGFV